jgi:uncharacterized membrane protein
MVLATYGSGLYKLLLLGHIISFLVAFAPAVISPVLAAQTKKDGEGVLMAVAGHLSTNGRRIHFPALIALGGFGITLVLVSDPAFAFDQMWVGIALVVWIGICGVVSGVILPNERKLAAGDLEAEKKVAMGGQIVTVLLLVMLYLMIWKPGL